MIQKLKQLFRKELPSGTGDVLRRVFSTDSGMVAVWQPEQFRNIVDYPTWERELLEDDDIIRHVRQGAFVPLYIHSDGAYDCAIRVGSSAAPAMLSERERRYLVVSSEPYLFRSRGTLAISGIEYIERSISEVCSTIRLDASDWSVTVHLIDWPEEPGAKTADDKVSPTALPDFIILLNPAAPETRFRIKVDTFEKPGNA